MFGLNSVELVAVAWFHSCALCQRTCVWACVLRLQAFCSFAQASVCVFQSFNLCFMMFVSLRSHHAGVCLKVRDNTPEENEQPKWKLIGQRLLQGRFLCCLLLVRAFSLPPTGGFPEPKSCGQGLHPLCAPTVQLSASTGAARINT